MNHVPVAERHSKQPDFVAPSGAFQTTVTVSLFASPGGSWPTLHVRTFVTGSKASEPQDEVTGVKVVVVGATGNVGTAVVRALTVDDRTGRA